ncbi:quinone-dependent dihydroorotate dehydrogenase [Phaeovibrio sulfidiphilus]|uniref:Dihydroorotate dehydrogenase (quinone) n=1 Tax=Phaeovibrio sulfidiphilus TaxID=1220600 RepID=A0A8J7CQB6_9PROT|nr:quinone-dependent dihydroorotate dehydrogenase [Phaeovibrio sulfidiphilus]
MSSPKSSPIASSNASSKAPPTWYSRLWPLVRRLDPETVHRLTFAALSTGLFARAPARMDDPILETTVWGRAFPNPVGLAAGLDKDARAFDTFLGLGFGFVEVGTVTPRPQPGNPRPRLFRLLEDRAIINRMGFNNAGMDAMAVRLRSRKVPGLVGVNLGKNKETEDAAADYEKAILRLAAFADYLVMNVSSPNTPGLRALQGRESLVTLVRRAREALDRAFPAGAGRPPLLLKIAPDLTDEDLRDIAAVALGEDGTGVPGSGGSATPLLDGLICTNTTIERPASLKSPQASQGGGLSGEPLKERSLEVLRTMYRLTRGRVPLVGVGGISSGEDAYRRIRAGASLIQVYSALIYEGPPLIERIKTDLGRCLRADGFTRLEDAVGADVPLDVLESPAPRGAPAVADGSSAPAVADGSTAPAAPAAPEATVTPSTTDVPAAPKAPVTTGDTPAATPDRAPASGETEPGAGETRTGAAKTAAANAGKTGKAGGAAANTGAAKAKKGSARKTTPGSGSKKPRS